MNVIFMGRKPSACEALRHLVSLGINVKAVVTVPKSQPVHWFPRLCDVAEELKIPVVTNDELYAMLKSRDKTVQSIDLVISYLYWRRIKEDLLAIPAPA